MLVDPDADLSTRGEGGPPYTSPLLGVPQRPRSVTTNPALGLGAILVWDADTVERRGELRGHSDTIQDVAFGPDGKAVTASWDGAAKIWDLESRRELATLRGHSGAILGVAVSPDGALVATGSIGGTAKLWDPATGRERLPLFGHDLVVNAAGFSPDGRFLATMSGDGTVALHLLPIDGLRDLAHERVSKPHRGGVSAVPPRGACPAAI
jgi:WD40 repeat protein